ncbi:hypothetical protein VCHA29O37_30091 [Vibrio chagasii]|nr:hypothetical protein VCHA29O37_30091 [Vibrio chagasii]
MNVIDVSIGAARTPNIRNQLNTYHIFSYSLFANLGKYVEGSIQDLVRLDFYLRHLLSRKCLIVFR